MSNHEALLPNHETPLDDLKLDEASGGAPWGGVLKPLPPLFVKRILEAFRRLR